MASVVAFIQEQGIPRALVEEKLAAQDMSALWMSLPSDPAPSSEALAKVSALVTVNKPVDASILSAYPNLKVLAVAFTGYGVHDLDACKARGVAVCNVPDYSSDSVAELAVLLALAVLRELPAGDRLVRAGGWGLSPGGTELRGKTVGIAGTGCIGCRTAALFKAFGCKLAGCKWGVGSNGGVSVSVVYFGQVFRSKLRC